MASLRRNRTMPTDGAIAKFLYTILKQLDLKSIDWNEVAGSLDITNGHAARMRFSRFKQQMEGIPTQTRKPKDTTPKTKKVKQKQDKCANTDKPIDDEGSQCVKRDPEGGVEATRGVEQMQRSTFRIKEELKEEDRSESMRGVEVKALTSPQIKPEPKEEPFQVFPAFETKMESQEVVWKRIQPRAELQTPGFGYFGETPAAYGTGHMMEDLIVKAEPQVKVEPRWDE